MRRLLVFSALSVTLAGCGTKGPLTLPPGPPGPPVLQSAFGSSPPPAKKPAADDSNKPVEATPEERQ